MIPRLLIFCMACASCFLMGAYAEEVKKLHRGSQDDGVVACDSTRSQRIMISTRGLTTLSFPVKPKDVVPGENVFDFHRIGNDLIIKPLSPSASTSLLVYLAERRCAFELKAVPGNGGKILTIKDPDDKLFEANFK
jgi:hypothetical protein